MVESWAYATTCEWWSENNSFSQFSFHHIGLREGTARAQQDPFLNEPFHCPPPPFLFVLVLLYKNSYSRLALIKRWVPYFLIPYTILSLSVSLSVFLSLSVSFSYTHTHTHTHTRERERKRERVQMISKWKHLSQYLPIVKTKAPIRHQNTPIHMSKLGNSDSRRLYEI